MATRKKKSTGGLPLPWEHEGTPWRAIVAGSRVKATLVVIAIVVCGVFVAREAAHASRVRETRAAIDQTYRAIDAFRAEVGRCPASADELVHPPRTANRRLEELPKDAWGRELYVECPSLNDPDGAEVVSAGPSGDFFVDDNLR